MQPVRSFIPKFAGKLPNAHQKLPDGSKDVGRSAIRKSNSFPDINIVDIQHGTNTKTQTKTTDVRTTITKINKKTTKGIGKVSLRKSKSFADLIVTCSKPSTKFKTQSQTNLKTTYRACGSKNLNTASTSKNPNLSKPSKVDLKNDDKLNKIQVPPKPKKPASYDYKARFNLLNEKHVALKDAYHEIKQNSAQSNNELATFINENDVLKQKINVLEKDSKKLKEVEEELKEITLENKQLQCEKLVLIDDFNKLIKDHAVLKEKYESFMKNYQIIKTNFTEKTEQLKYALLRQEEYKNELQKNETTRRTLHEMIQSMKGNIRVFCRIRPSLPSENDKILCNINCIDEATLELNKSREGTSFASNKTEYSFDKVFAPATPQCEVFEDLAQLVQSALDGYHICVFAYGQTGSGKTYTMQGEETDAALGIIPRSMNLLFETIDKQQKVGWEYLVEVSVLEIYNEIIRDLLDTQPKQHEIRYNEGKGVTVTNLKVQSIETVQEFRELMSNAHRNRAVAATNFNEHSSRSHALTKIYLECFNRDFKVRHTGSINLVDLAGSESAKTSSAERLAETKNINRSLSALGNVILALRNKESHVPYRNSKLTYVLQSCLGGNSKTLMIVNISPLEECFNETMSSLRFADTVKGVKVNSRRNKTYIDIQN